MKARLTYVHSNEPQAKHRPLVAFIPGGPGLSSETLRSMDLLSRSFDLAYVDIPGTGGLDEVTNPTFYSVTAAIETELRKINRPLVLCGHSFGALFGIELTKSRYLDLAGLIAIAAPISATAYAMATKQYYKHMTLELKSAVLQWEKKPSRETLAALFASYGTLYFSPATVKRGQKLLSSDLVSPKTFERVLPVLSKGEPRIDFIEMLKAFSGPKYMLAGQLDLMLPPQTLHKDATSTGCEFHEIADAGHFIAFDQPEAVAGLIEKLFVDSSKG